MMPVPVIKSYVPSVQENIINLMLDTHLYLTGLHKKDFLWA